MVRSTKEIDGKQYPYMIHLPADEHWRATTQTGLEEYISRYRKSTTMNMLLDAALYHCSKKTGDQLWDKVGEFFIFNKERKGVIYVNKTVDDNLAAFKARLENTTTHPDIAAKWSARFIIASILYVYCEHLINFKGKQILVPATYDIEVPDAIYP